LVTTTGENRTAATSDTLFIEAISQVSLPPLSSEKAGRNTSTP
jgi:hypothetical protein